MRDPAFWWRKAGLRSGPAGAAGGGLWRDRGAAHGAGRRARRHAGAVRRQFHPRRRRQDPDRDALAKMLADAGERVFCLSRGYGGSVAGPKLVDAHADTADQVGDEALLLARAAPTIIARDRVAGAQLARAKGASVVVMDDGLQNGCDRQGFHARRRRRQARHRQRQRVSGRPPARAARGAACARSDALLVVGEDRRRGARSSRRRKRTACRCCMASSSPMPRRSRRSSRARCWPSPASAIRTSFSRPSPRPASPSRRAKAFPTITASRRRKPPNW